MTPYGEFIIFMMADTFLTHEYEYCLRIGKSDYSFFSNTCLFEANLLRFVSIASAKLFEHILRENEENFIDHIDFLYQALNCAENAMKLYSAEHVAKKELKRAQAMELF